MAKEQWRPIPGWEGAYEASDHGRVRSVDRRVTCAGGITRRYRGRVLKGVTDRAGYRRVRLSRNGEGRYVSVHRAVVEAFRGTLPPELQIDHINGDKADNRLCNLQPVTPFENIRRAIQAGVHRGARIACPRGHQLAGGNLVPSSLKKGWRECLACDRAANHYPPGTRDTPEFRATADSFYRALMPTATAA